MKSKHIDGTVSLKCDYLVWPWPWPWPWIFKIKHGICYISVRNGPIATKQKANISIELKASNVTMGFDLGHDLDLENSRSNMEFAISQSKMVRLPRNEKQTYRLNSRLQMWPWGFALAMTLTLNFQGQIWNLLYLNQKWSEGQVWIYKIVTRVTSDVGMPWTHLFIWGDQLSSLDKVTPRYLAWWTSVRIWLLRL